MTSKYLFLFLFVSTTLGCNRSENSETDSDVASSNSIDSLMKNMIKLDSTLSNNIKNIDSILIENENIDSLNQIYLSNLSDSIKVESVFSKYKIKRTNSY